MSEKSWKQCKFCLNEIFDSPFQFGNHLRIYHSKIEGGSHVCSYGPNGMCPLLPYEGVSGRDYDSHVAKCHIFPTANTTISDFYDNNLVPSQTKKRFENDSCNFPNPISNNTQANDEDEPSLRFDRPNLINEINWNFFSASHDLTSILNDPSKSRSYYDNLFTKDWGMNFVETNIIGPYPIVKKPSPVLFETYVAKVKRRNEDLNGTRINFQTENHESLSKCPLYLSSFDIVPSLFFDPNFSLDQNDTFIKLISLFSDETDLSDSKNLISLESLFDNRPMNDIQKSLSEYLDTVEQDLSKQICSRSQDFFQVMSSIDLIMEKLKKSIKQVTSVRSVCREIESKLVEPIDKIVELTKRRSRYQDVFKKINWIATVHQTQPTIQLLLSKNDYAGALDLISTSEEVVAQELNGIISLRYLRLQLMEIEKVIEQMLNEEFVKYLTAEWNRPLIDDSNFEVEREKLLSIIYGMLKLQNFNFIDTFREEAFTAIKTSVKQTVIETLSFEDNIEVARIDTSLFEQLECLEYDKWFECLRTVFERLLILMKRIRSVYSVINDGFYTIANNPLSNKNSDSSNPMNCETETKIILQSDCFELSSRLKEILFSICDFAHTRSAKIIDHQSRDADYDRFNSTKFLRLIQLIENFINDCQQLYERKSPNLSLVIQIQSNKFITKFHDEHKHKLKQLLNSEQWKSVSNLREEFQQLCIELIDTKFHHGTESFKEIYDRFKSSTSYHASSSSMIKNQRKQSINYIEISGQKFIVVNSVINFILMILDYCELAEEFSSFSGDILLRLIDLYKLFNSRTSQLILGAEALKLTSLKTISARTLTISMRSLQFNLLFLPMIHKHFQSLSKTKQSMLKHLDELHELYENHWCKIPEKIISLVKEVVCTHINKWVPKAPIPSVSFQTISQHLNRLHDNIQDILPPEILSNLFQRIHAIVIETFKEHLEKLKISKDGSPQHGMVTQELAFYVQNLKNLSIGSDLQLNIDLI
ncbi:Vacuolar protein sorting-associated protein 54 [Sarcoptes scabiei]|uniref:Vacuolar protein sorting-associated protein 54 n=1 Tax=Sarcoptes scabiei TaxID=52283 RepID=A0A834R9T6_SARSC|nr:Vacuolar protein sorting-associated protein 54 [Sarcoptes scabiei]